MIHRVAMAIWEHEHPLGQNVLAGDVKFPNQDPQWNNNTPGNGENMRDLIIRGIQESVPRSQNLSKALMSNKGRMRQ
jgi:hypothetical protein